MSEMTHWHFLWSTALTFFFWCVFYHLSMLTFLTPQCHPSDRFSRYHLKFNLWKNNWFFGFFFQIDYWSAIYFSGFLDFSRKVKFIIKSWLTTIFDTSLRDYSLRNGFALLIYFLGSWSNLKSLSDRQRSYIVCWFYLDTSADVLFL